ncbi:serine hydrolase [Actinoplanes cyaneus]|uniref:serine hydrolase n=1 Tax=Actinoplanes cyaneus TaxID=52696 RepID=UPI001EF386A6|nr:serine hydrolase [Actinoplanes cyaneus]
MQRYRVGILAGAAVVVLGGGGLIYAGLNDDGSDGASALPSSLTVGDNTTAGAAAAVSPSPTGPSPEELAKAEHVKREKQLTAELKKLTASSPEFSVAVKDLKTGQTYAYRGDEKYDTASIVKAQILACMLLKDQDAGRDPSSGEMTLAKPMIQLSDNNATTSLFTRIGGKSAVGKCNKRLGLSDTVVNTSWGLTRTTVDDQITLLNEFVDTKGPLDADSRKTAFKLMNTVDAAQDWGVPAIAKSGETFTVKNGWDTRSADGGLWAVNTIGRVTKGDDVDVSVAVLSHNNKSMQSGINLVEKVAKLTRQYLKY